MATLALTGDVMLGRHAGEVLLEQPVEHAWGDVLPILHAADARLVNLECVIAEGGKEEPGRVFHFRAPPRAIDALKAARVDVACVANNHVLDYGGEALRESLQRLDAAGVARAGSGSSRDEAWRPATIDAGGLRVAVLAFTDNTPEWSVERRQPGVAYAPIDPAGEPFERLQKRVRTAADGADLVIVSAHWGPNMRRHPPEAFQRFARTVVDAGAHVFWGHSAHLFQAMERRGAGVILYDTGDFVDDYRTDPDARNDLSFLFLIEAEAGRAGPVELVPTQIAPAEAQVNVAGPGEAAWARQRMLDLCAALGTRVEATEHGLLLPARPRP